MMWAKKIKKQNLWPNRQKIFKRQQNLLRHKICRCAQIKFPQYERCEHTNKKKIYTKRNTLSSDEGGAAGGDVYK